MKKQVRLDGLKGAMALFAVALLQSSSAIAETEVVLVADFGDGIEAAPDGFDDMLVRDSETGLLTILYLESDGQARINHSGEVSGIDIIDPGHGYLPSFMLDEHGCSVQVLTGGDRCWIDNTHTSGSQLDWAAFLVDGAEGTLVLETTVDDQLVTTAVDQEPRALTRYIFPHEDGGSGYEGRPGLADELRCRQYTHDQDLVAPVSTWQQEGAELGTPVALAAPGEVYGVTSFHVFVPIPGGPIGEGYAPNVGMPGLEMELLGGIEMLPPPVPEAPVDTVDELPVAFEEETLVESSEPVLDEDQAGALDVLRALPRQGIPGNLARAGEVEEDLGENLDQPVDEFQQADGPSTNVLFARTLEKVFADRPEEPRAPSAHVLTDSNGRITHVAFDPGTQRFETPPLFVAPANSGGDGRGVLQVKVQGQLSHVDIPGEQAGSGYDVDQLVELHVVAADGGPSIDGIGAVLPSIRVASGAITEVRIIGDPGLYNRPPRIDVSAGGGFGATLRCRLGHEGTGTVRFNGQDVSMGSNWKAWAADFDDDGDNDLFWHDQQTGRSAVWCLGRDALVEQSVFGLLPQVNRNWTIGAVGDFDQGTPGANIFWRNRKDGKNSIWGIDASKPWSNNSSWLHPESSLVTPVADTNWIAVGCNPGGNRLLWWNEETGVCAVWTLSVDMSGNSSPENWTSKAAWLENAAGEIMATDTAWRPVGFANLAGRAPGAGNARDVLWQQPAQGRAASWLMNSRFNRVDENAVDEGAGWIEQGGADAIAGPGGRLLVGQYILEVTLDGETAQRTVTNLFWSIPGLDGASSWRLDRRFDDETGLLGKPWALKSREDVH